MKAWHCPELETWICMHIGPSSCIKYALYLQLYLTCLPYMELYYTDLEDCKQKSGVVKPESGNLCGVYVYSDDNIPTAPEKCTCNINPTTHFSCLRYSGCDDLISTSVVL